MKTLEESAQVRCLVVTQALVINDLVCASLQIQRISRMITTPQGKRDARELLRTSCDAFSLIESVLVPRTGDCLWEATSCSGAATRGIRSAERSVTETKIHKGLKPEMESLLNLNGERSKREQEELMVLQMSQMSERLVR